MSSSIDEAAIRGEVEQGKQRTSVERLLEKAATGKGLSAVETSGLFLHLEDAHLEQARGIGESLRLHTKGPVAAFYTCLYITNACVNDCGYCGFRKSNAALERITLSEAEIQREAAAIRESGHSNAILIGGTLPEEQYRDRIITGTAIMQREGLTPWIEFENLSPATLHELRDMGAAHFVLFQETYDSKAYGKWHQRSPLKKDYEARLLKIDEAVEAGFDNIGVGALLGLTTDRAFEVLGLYHHAMHLKQRDANVCISIPTLKPAPGLSIPEHYRVASGELERIAIVLRLTLPEVSLALSGRERPELRDKLSGVVDHVGCGGRTNPGARTTYAAPYERGQRQFALYDVRTPAEIRQRLEKQGITVLPEVSWGSKTGTEAKSFKY